MSKKKLIIETIGIMAVGMFALLGWYLVMLVVAAW